MLSTTPRRHLSILYSLRHILPRSVDLRDHLREFAVVTLAMVALQPSRHSRESSF
jgi:hypothetical protein